MKQFLKDYLLNEKGIEPEYYTFAYSEDKNHDALTNKWLENRTSYIYKVGVLAAIDSNKCDYVHIVFGTLRGRDSEPELKGHIYFNNGENDDMGRVLNRVLQELQYMHPAFEV